MYFLLDHLAGVGSTIVVGGNLDVNTVEGNVALHTGNVEVLHTADGLLGQVLNNAGAAIQSNAVVVLEALALVVTTLTIDEAVVVGSPTCDQGLTETKLLVCENHILSETALGLILIVVLNSNEQQRSIVLLQGTALSVHLTILAREVAIVVLGVANNKGVNVVSHTVNFLGAFV